MRRARSSVVVAFALAALQASAAEDNSAPLESTKQELRQLEGVQKNKAGATASDGVRMSTPVLEVRGEGSVTQQWTQRKKAEERQRQQQQQRNADNWLVNGVDQLARDGTKDGTKNAATAAAQVDELTPADSRTASDPSDPQYLLKLFDDQKKRHDPKESESRVRSTPAPDPFAPFLQDWLGTSPVREQVMDQFRKNNESGGANAAAGGTPDYGAPPVVNVTSSPNALPRESAAQAPPNPYLVELNTPVSVPSPMAGVAPTAPLDRAWGGPEPVPAPFKVAPLDPLPDSRAPAKGPPPGLEDDRKYFPQLKKF